jgi:hypothetical protein
VIRRHSDQTQPRQIVQETLSQKKKSQKMAGRVDQVTELLPHKGVALSSNPNGAKKIHCEI